MSAKDTPKSRDGFLKPAEVRARTGIKVTDLTRLAREKRVDGVVKGKSGKRKIYFFPEAAVPFIEEIAARRKEGSGLVAAVEEASKTLDPHAPETALNTLLRPRLSRVASGEEVATFFQALLRRYDFTNSQVNKRFQWWLRAVASRDQETGAWNQALQRFHARPNSDDLGLHAALQGTEVTFVQARSLADLFGVHTLMIDPIFAEQVDESCLVLSLESDFLPVGDPRDHQYGHLVEYRVPWKRLLGSEALLGGLVLKPGGKSDVHSHPGDELMLVLSGEVVLNIHSTGVSTSLQEGDYAHFYAEQTHSAENRSTEKAELLIIRFSHHDTASARDEARRWVEELVVAWESGKRENRKRIPPWLIHWLRVMSPPEVQPEAGSSTVQDFHAMGRFLRQVRETRGETVGKISKGTRWKPQAYGQLEVGVWPDADSRFASISDLNHLAKAYNVEPFLLYGFAFPEVPYLAVVRGVASPPIEGDGGDLRASPGRKYRKFQYFYPCRNLMHSDISISVVRLAAGSEMLYNSHPGFELVIPLSGSVTLTHGERDQRQDLTVAARHCAYYSSDQRHRLVNPWDKPAVCLVLRFSPRSA